MMHVSGSFSISNHIHFQAITQEQEKVLRQKIDRAATAEEWTNLEKEVRPYAHVKGGIFDYYNEKRNEFSNNTVKKLKELQENISTFNLDDYVSDLQLCTQIREQIPLPIFFNI